MARDRISVETNFEVEVGDRSIEGARAEIETFMDAVAALEGDDLFPDVLESDVTAEIRNDGGLNLQVRLTIGSVIASHAVARAQAFVEHVISSIGAAHLVAGDKASLVGTGASGDVVFDNFHTRRLVDA